MWVTEVPDGFREDVDRSILPVAWLRELTPAESCVTVGLWLGMSGLVEWLHGLLLGSLNLRSGFLQGGVPKSVVSR